MVWNEVRKTNLSVHKYASIEPSETYSDSPVLDIGSIRRAIVAFALCRPSIFLEECGLCRIDSIEEATFAQDKYEKLSFWTFNRV